MTACTFFGEEGDQSVDLQGDPFLQTEPYAEEGAPDKHEAGQLLRPGQRVVEHEAAEYLDTQHQRHTRQQDKHDPALQILVDFFQQFHFIPPHFLVCRSALRHGGVRRADQKDDQRRPSVIEDPVDLTPIYQDQFSLIDMGFHILPMSWITPEPLMT